MKKILTHFLALAILSYIMVLEAWILIEGIMTSNLIHIAVGALFFMFAAYIMHFALTVIESIYDDISIVINVCDHCGYQSLMDADSCPNCGSPLYFKMLVIQGEED